MLGVHGYPEVHGENLPLDLWSLYMARATEGTPATDFPAPDWEEFEISERGRAVSPYTTATSAYASTGPYYPEGEFGYEGGYGGG
jgi:hypothetical protein